MAYFHLQIPLIEANIAASGGDPWAWHECWYGNWSPGGESLYAVFQYTLLDRRLGDMFAAAYSSGSLFDRPFEHMYAFIGGDINEHGADQPWKELLVAVLRSRRAWQKLTAVMATRDSAQLWQAGRRCLAASIPQFSIAIWEGAAAQCSIRLQQEAERKKAAIELVRGAAEWASANELPAPAVSDDNPDEALEQWRTRVLDPAANYAFWVSQRLFLERFRIRFTTAQRSRATLLIRAADPPRRPTIAELKFLIETQRSVIDSLLVVHTLRARDD